MEDMLYTVKEVSEILKKSNLNGEWVVVLQSKEQNLYGEKQKSPSCG